jgi:hypothetical protein
MIQKHLIIWNCDYISTNPQLKKLIQEKQKLPLCKCSNLIKIDSDAEIRIKSNVEDIQKLFSKEVITIKEYKEYLSINLCTAEQQNKLSQTFKENGYLFIFLEGTPGHLSIILKFVKEDENVFYELQQNHPDITLQNYDIPPTSFAYVDINIIRDTFFAYFSKKEPELFSIHTHKFLRSPHILTNLFSHVMRLESKNHLNYVSVLKALSDCLRELLMPYIKKIEKNHSNLWSTFYGEKISFLDGGMTRIVGLAGTEPMGVRVGIYSVIPGETDPQKREEWQLYPYVLGDVICDREHIKEKDSQTDTKRLQEAARYILEALSAIQYVKSKNKEEAPKIILLHGPLQNKFLVYDETIPNYIPGVSKQFLAENGLTKEEIMDKIKNIPNNYKKEPMWNGCIAVYAYLMKSIFEASTQYIGVVERSHSRTFTDAVLRSLSTHIRKSTREQLWSKIHKYEFTDELLFGCILDEGEYFTPIEIQVNTNTRQAHEHWKAVIEQYPKPKSTILKTSSCKFPFRIDFNKATEESYHDTISLVYHTSLLLPQYSFPVGIDIADKYAKIPDWLSKGISERLTAYVLKKAMELGDERILLQLRQRLSITPRDFFFRPSIR